MCRTLKSLKMVVLRERFENLLIKTIEAKNEFQFNYIVNDLKVNLDLKLECLGNFSIFETVLSTPKSQKFIELCLSKGCSFYKKNDVGIYPLRYAINSLCVDNLRTLINIPPISVNSDRGEIHHLMIINERLEDGNNYLHFLVNVLTDENSLDVSKMIEIMIMSGCNSNLKNKYQLTPLQLLLQKDSDRCELVHFFVNNSAGELLNDDIIRDMEERGVSLRTSSYHDLIRDGKFMIHLLDQWNEKRFLEEFQAFEDGYKTTNKFYTDCLQMLEVAVARNMVEAARLLVEHGVCVNTHTSDSKFRLAPAFLACDFGHHPVLQLLLEQPILRFKCPSARRNLLHQICLAKNVHPADRLRCFDLIIGDPRCNKNIVNGLDGEGQAPLYYACYNGHEEIAKELLRRGAFIGRESIINCIDNDVLKEFLDECIKCTTNVKSKDCEIHIDYRFLTPPDVDNEFHPEVAPVQVIANNEKLKELVLHPVIASFLNLKWKKINFIVYCNLLIYFFFMLFLGFFVIRFFHDPVYNDYNFQNASGNQVVVLDDRDDSTLFPSTTINPLTAMKEEEDGLHIRFGSADNDTDVGGGAAGRHSSAKIPASSQPFVPPIVTAADQPTPTDQPTPYAYVPPAEKPNLLSLLFGFSSVKSSSSGSRSKRSVDKDNRNLWQERFESHYAEHAISYRICFFGVILLTIYEIVQCVTSIKNYFFKLSNWLDLFLIFLSYLVLVGSFAVQPDDFKKVRALMILVMAAQSIQLIAKVSVLSMSLHMAIFKRVCATFLKTIALYFILILAFAMSFYTLNEPNKKKEDDGKTETGNLKLPSITIDFFHDGTDVTAITKPNNDDENNGFEHPFISFITTVRMMLSDFDTVEIDGEDTFQGIMFLLFVVLITVVLFNLLNALAISDTNEIMRDAELVDTKKRISILHSYEKLFIFLTLSFANILPEMTSIKIKPNRDNFVSNSQRQSKSGNSFLEFWPKELENVCNKLTKKATFWKREKNVRLGGKSSQKVCDFVETQQRTQLIADSLETNLISADEIVKDLGEDVIKKIYKQTSLPSYMSRAAVYLENETVTPI